MSINSNQLKKWSLPSFLPNSLNGRYPSSLHSLTHKRQIAPRLSKWSLPFLFLHPSIPKCQITVSNPANGESTEGMTSGCIEQSLTDRQVKFSFGKCCGRWVSKKGRQAVSSHSVLWETQLQLTTTTLQPECVISRFWCGSTP